MKNQQNVLLADTSLQRNQKSASAYAHPDRWGKFFESTCHHIQQFVVMLTNSLRRPLRHRSRNAFFRSHTILPWQAYR